MKKIFVLLSFISYQFTIAQTNNTLPSSGNVGIGTTNPNTKLQVCGTAKFDSAVVVMDTMYIQKDIVGGQDIKIDGNAYLNGKLFFTGGLNQGNYYNKLAVIDISGEVKEIGWNTLSSSVYQTDCFILTDANGNNLQYPGPSWKSTGGPQYGILSTGTTCPAKVGILTDNPQAHLDVNGKTYLRQSLGVGVEPNQSISLYVNEINFGGIPTPTLFKAEGSLGFLSVNRYGQTLIQTSDNDYGLKVISTTNKGKGILIRGGSGNNSADTYALLMIETNSNQGARPIFYVDGKTEITYARELKLTTDATWPDFVFESGYKRMNYLEKEKYFKENKHLPGIETAEEIETNGLPVSTTLSGLTKNVEENSLDLIEVQKEIEALKKKNEELEKELAELKKEKGKKKSKKKKEEKEG